MLATEMYKILNGLSPGIMQDIFETNYYKHSQCASIFLKKY